MTSAEMRRVLADEKRPCLFHAGGPCYHPACLSSHHETLKREDKRQREHDAEKR